MFHLLPEKQKKVLRREYLLRLLFVFLCFVAGSLVVASVFLFPSYLLSSRKFGDLEERKNQIKANITAKTDPNLGKFLTSLKGNLSALKVNRSTSSSTAYIKEVTDLKNSGIKLKEFFIDYGNTPTKIIVSGRSSTRDSLTKFYRDMQTVKDFAKVELPISDFAQDKDIDFHMNVTLKN